MLGNIWFGCVALLTAMPRVPIVSVHYVKYTVLVKDKQQSCAYFERRISICTIDIL